MREDYEHLVSEELLEVMEERKKQWHLRPRIELLEHLLSWCAGEEHDT